MIMIDRQQVIAHRALGLVANRAKPTLAIPGISVVVTSNAVLANVPETLDKNCATIRAVEPAAI